MVSLAAQDKFDQILSEAVASKTTPGLFFAVSDADGLLYSRQVGTKLFDDPSSDLIDEDSVFWLCSQTKLVTTIAALQLVEQGKITLDTPIREILPEIATPVVVTASDAAGKPTATTPATVDITFGQLITHTSGLDYYLDGNTPISGPLSGMPPAYSHNYTGESVSVFFDILKGSFPGVPLRFEPGTGWGYGFGCDCAGFIVERLTGKSLERYFQDHIFSPLGITSLSFYLTPALKERLIPLSYRREDGSIELVDFPPVLGENSAKVVHLGGVGLYGTQTDYLTLLRHLIQIKSGHEIKHPILSRPSVDLLFTPSLPSPAAAMLNALLPILVPNLGMPEGSAQFSGALLINTADIAGKRGAGSGCWSGWANTYYWMDPTNGVAALVGTQISPYGDDKVTRIGSELEKELYAALRKKEA